MTSLTFFIFFLLVLIAHGRVCVLCLGVWYLTEIIIDKSPKYGCHFSLSPMVIWGIVAALYFCILLGTKKKLLLLCLGLESSCDSMSEENSTEA